MFFHAWWVDMEHYPAENYQNVSDKGKHSFMGKKNTLNSR
jgi:hypothetical protein